MNNPDTIFYLARHGKTEWNTQGLIQGHKDSKLTSEGENQAMQLAKELREVKFDLVFSSDLLRAKRTAEIVALEKQLAVQTTRLLRERTYGIYEGCAYDAMKKYDAFIESLSHSERFTHKSDRVESDEEIVGRMFTFIRETAVIHPGKTILLLSHADIIYTTLVHLGFGTYKTFHLSAIGNAGYAVLKTGGSDISILSTVRIEQPKEDI